MVHPYFKLVFVALAYIFCYINGFGRAANVVGTYFLAVERHFGVCSYALKAQEVFFALHVGRKEKLLEVGSAVQVAVFFLQRAVIVVKIVGYVGSELVAAVAHFPVVVERCYKALARCVGLGEADFALSHGLACCQGDASLFRVVYGTIEVIYHAVMVDHGALVSEHFVVRLRRHNEVFALPVGPVNHVVAGGKGVERVIFACRVEGREVEHYIQVAHLHYLRVAGYCSVAVVCEYGVVLVSVPLPHVVREGNAYAFAFWMSGVFSAGIVEHHELVAKLLFVYSVHRTLVLGQLLPPLGILVVIRQYGLLVGFPQVRLGDVLFS